MNPRLLSAVLLAALCSGCGPLATFEPYTPKHPLNLAKVLGPQVVLLGPDTLPLTIYFDPATRLNHVVVRGRTDTIVRAWVTRQRGLYYLTCPKAPDSYWVQAVRIRRGRVQGLMPFEAARQAEILAGEVTLPLVGRYQELVVARDDQHDLLRLRFDARVLRPFYQSVLDTLPKYRIVPAAEFDAAVAAKAPAAPAAKTPAGPPTAAALIQSVYPNPAREQVTVAGADTTPRTVQLLSLSGQVLRSRRSTASRTTLDLTGLPAGGYVLRVRDETDGRTASQRLLVQP
ncbi:T9SS type A sorting domain-containing protein [Hymenobacter jeollabukensis]|uniref:T9SS type A sorting domain-containing protein n=1 Tax=Hymenobacter jeollabukensis TaxID=2025313 RepID=A0A5R8WQU8_9BACT|nr:T9SS type A sorting domain-containing protein [Hymenobacter jeollabukensis]TLM93128.1 T9SS type A sorting domain-containing protein [Hymenobacter jeollabukensis]